MREECIQVEHSLSVAKKWYLPNSIEGRRPYSAIMDGKMPESTISNNSKQLASARNYAKIYAPGGNPLIKIIKERFRVTRFDMVRLCV